MKAKSAKEVLIAARWIIENVGWCQQSYVKDKTGHNMTIFPERMSDQDLTQVDCACASGAIYLVQVAEPHFRDDALNILSQHVRARQAHLGHISSWNDSIGRTKEEVLDLFDRAIRSLP